MTTSATGERGGFTLVEILLALALIALLATIFIGGSSALLADKALSPDEQFWKACGEARKEALEERRSVILTFDPKEKGYVLNDGAGRRVLPVSGPDDLVIDFHPAQSDSSSSVLIGGTLVETEPMPSVTFYNDGTCMPFRAQLRTRGGAHVLSIDPWTCAPVLAKTDANPRAFTLIEVMLALVIFAMTAVVLGGAYVNVLSGYESARKANANDSDVSFARSQLLVIPDLTTAEAGAEFDDLQRHVKWTAEIDATSTTDLFTVVFTCVITEPPPGDTRTVSETFMLTRPTWSDPTSRTTLRQNAANRIAQAQGKQAK